MNVLLGVFCIFVWSGLLMLGMSKLKQTGRYNIHTGQSNTPNRIPIILRNQIMSAMFVMVVSWLFSIWIIVGGSISVMAVLVQTVGILLIYDFWYYVMHRALHHPKLMKMIHGVHHKARKISAAESLYLHPVENLAGLVLLFVVMALFVKMHIITFLVVFWCYATMMILNHSGMVFPHPIFIPINRMAIVHDIHHSDDLNANYASVFTSIYDVIFKSYKLGHFCPRGY